MVRNGILIGLLVLAAVGGWWNYQRERSGVCSDPTFTDFVRPELVEEYLTESSYYENLQSAVVDTRLSDADRATFAEQIARIEDILENGEVVGREISPSNDGEKTCVVRLNVSATEQDTGLFSGLWREANGVEARFRLTIEKITGAEFRDKYDRRRKNIMLLQELEAGESYETVETATFGRRSFTLVERRFPEVNYTDLFEADADVEPGLVSDIPQ